VCVCVLRRKEIEGLTFLCKNRDVVGWRGGRIALIGGTISHDCRHVSAEDWILSAHAGKDPKLIHMWRFHCLPTGEY
jgi:hypothetical protein